MNSKFTSIVRLLLGSLLVIFGSNKFLHFIPLSQPAGSASNFLNSLHAAGYIFPIVGILEMLIGIMLLIKIWDAFALILLTPITINILLFHLFLDSPDLWIALIITTLNGILIYKHRKRYSHLFIQ